MLEMMFPIVLIYSGSLSFTDGILNKQTYIV